MEKLQLSHIIEALIFASDSPLSIKQIISVLDNVDEKDIQIVIDDLLNQENISMPL